MMNNIVHELFVNLLIESLITTINIAKYHISLFMKYITSDAW